MSHEIQKIESTARPEAECKRPIDYILASAKKRPDPLEFIDNSKPGYTEAEIRKEMAHVEELERKFAKVSQRAEAMEIITIEYGEEFQWFGENSELDRTSKIDDLNGVDGVWHFNVPGFPYRIALAIDTSMRSELTKKQQMENETTAVGKIKSIKEKIERNITKIKDPKISTVKYYKSRDGQPVDQTLIVPIVIGLEGENADKLISLFGRIAELRRRKNLNESEKTELIELEERARNHPAQKIFLLSAIAQLSRYSEELKNEKGFKSFYRTGVSGLENIVRDILKKKEHIATGELENDAVYQKIKETLGEIKRK